MGGLLEVLRAFLDAALRVVLEDLRVKGMKCNCRCGTGWFKSERPSAEAGPSFLTLLNQNSRVSITPMPTIFRVWKRGKLLDREELLR